MTIFSYHDTIHFQALTSQDEGTFAFKKKNDQDQDIVTLFYVVRGQVKTEPFKVERDRFQASTGESFDNILQIKEKFALTSDYQDPISKAKADIKKRGATYVACIIQTYGIDPKEGQAALIEIAKLTAQQDGFATSRHIQNYQIDSKTEEGQAALIEIAKLTAQQDGGATSEYIQNYQIHSKTPEGQAALIEIAKLAAQQNGEGTSKYIQNYQIHSKTPEGQAALIEIAKLAAQHNGGATSHYIQFYQIHSKTPKGQAALIEISKLAAQQDGEGTSTCIQNYQINSKTTEGKAALIEIATLATQQDGDKMLPFLKAFGIEDKRLTIELIALEYSTLPITKPSYFIAFPLKAVLSDLQGDKKGDEALDELKRFCSENKLPPIHDSVKNQSSLRFLAIAAIRLSLVDPDLRPDGARFLSILKQILKKPPYLWLDILEALLTTKSTKLTKEYPKDHFLLPSLFLSSLTNKARAQVLLNAKSKSKRRTLFVKDASFLDAFLMAAIPLTKEPQKFSMHLFDRLLEKEELDKAELKQAFLAIRGLFLLKRTDLLEKAAQDPYRLLSLAYRQAFEETLGLTGTSQEKIDTLFAAFNRDSLAFIRYAAALKKLPDAKLVLDAFSVCLKDQMEGLYPACRYSSPHLNPLFASGDALKQSWMQALPSKNVAAEEESQASLPLASLLLRSFREGHVDKATYPVLFATLNGEKSPFAAKPLEEALLACRDNQELLEEAIKMLPKEGHPDFSLQFNHDIKGLLSELKAVKSSLSLTAVDTDEMQDLFLCGTEVEGSCQRIDGDPSLNKCLLAYVMDGKNRLLALKDANGKIKARAILRLLITEEGRPALFLERIYPRIIKKEWETALIDLAMQKARALSIPLFSKEVGEKRGNVKTLISQGSRAPFEYVDASNGVQKEGKFSIPDAYCLLE